MKDKIPKSLVLNGTDNNGKRHRYSFEKTDDFKKGFLELMENLGFEKGKIDSKFVIRDYVEDPEDPGHEIDRVWVKKVSDIIDVCWYFENNKYEVDVFFGKEKVIILIMIKSSRNRDKKRREMLDKLEDESDWISEDEKEKRLKKNKELINKKAIRQ